MLPGRAAATYLARETTQVNCFKFPTPGQAHLWKRMPGKIQPMRDLPLRLQE